MSEELQVQNEPQVELEEVIVSTPQAESTSQEPQGNAFEDRAREQGWRPKEEWEGDPEKWRPAKEFVERGELFGKIDTLGRDLKETKKVLRMLQDHHAKVRETEYKRAVDELKALQKRHLEEGNSDGYLETSEMLTDLKAEQKAREIYQEAVPQQQPADPRFTEWVDKNQWYARDAKMRDYADTLGMAYAQRHPELDPEEVLKYVTTEVKERYKDRFENPKRRQAGAVESPVASTPVNKKQKIELTDEERRVMNSFLRNNVMEKDVYLKELALSRGEKA